MCKATDEVMQYVEKSHNALAETISNLFGDLNKRLTRLEKRDEITHELIKDIRKTLRKAVEKI